jgi:hypothetical protein
MSVYGLPHYCLRVSAVSIGNIDCPWFRGLPTEWQYAWRANKAVSFN